MGAAFTGHLQDRAKAQDQGTAIPGGVSSSSPNGQKYLWWGWRVGHKLQPSSLAHPLFQNLQNHLPSCLSLATEPLLQGHS